jgi:putative transposase
LSVPWVRAGRDLASASIAWEHKAGQVWGRFSSFPVESDEQFWVVARYVERNTLRAQLVLRAEQWRRSSLWRRFHGTAEERPLLATRPTERPPDWVERAHWTDDERDLEWLRQSVHRARPFSLQEWQKRIAKRLGLESAYRPSGRPSKMGHFESGP